MKLYVVWYSYDYEGGFIEEVCSTQEKAEKVLKSIKDDGDSRGIDEIELDKECHIPL